MSNDFLPCQRSYLAGIAPENFSFFPERKLNSLYSEKIQKFKSAVALSNYNTGIKKEK
jgi:hypothetical protein